MELSFSWIVNAAEGIVQEMVRKECEPKGFGVEKYFTEEGIGVNGRQYRGVLYELPTSRGPNAMDKTSIVQT
jgi:hypothetical protein